MGLTKKVRAVKFFACGMAAALIMSLMPMNQQKVSAASGKTDVVDFGCEQLDSSIYNNLLTVEIANSFAYTGTPNEAKSGVNVGDFTINDTEGNAFLSFVAGGKTNNRYRTTNTNIIRYDEKSKKDADGKVYSGFIYSNSSSTDNVHIYFYLKAGDTLELMLGSNGGAALYKMVAPDGSKTDLEYKAESQVEKFTFNAPADGAYQLYCSNEKLVLARASRKHASKITVTGTATFDANGTGIAAPTGYNLVFENLSNGAKSVATVGSDGKYSVELYEGVSYKTSLENANAYVISSNTAFTPAANAANYNCTINPVPIVTINGKINGLSADALKKLSIEFTSNATYVPELTVNGDGTYKLLVESGIEYTIKAVNVNDYLLSESVFLANENGSSDFNFTAKPTYEVTLETKGASADLSNAVITFTNINEDGYTYSFKYSEKMMLRDGQYKIEISNATGASLKLAADMKVNGANASSYAIFEATETGKLGYRTPLKVGKDKEFKTIGEAIDAIRRMVRVQNQYVEVMIDPGNYEEMLVIDVPNVILKNASSKPSIELTNKGVDISDNAVRITWYYGHGYTYYSMGSDCKYDADLLAVNKSNGYASFVNPGSGTTNGSYWNATVVVAASGFRAENIIFENSFNQYVSAKSLEDVIVKQTSAKEGSISRTEMDVAGDTTVQQKEYVERAAALAIQNNISNVAFSNCKFIGRQDTLYGGTGSTVAFDSCAIYGSTDYIFGGMTAVFKGCDLVFNTNDQSDKGRKDDVGYITAPQQSSGRGFLFLSCHITSTTPGVDTESAFTSKPGYFGRPWQANTSEAVFINTTIDKADSSWGDNLSLIKPEGWLSTLSGTSDNVGEFGTIEISGVDNSSNRVSWAKVYAEAKTTDGTPATVESFLGGDSLFKSITVAAVSEPDPTPSPIPTAAANEANNNSSTGNGEEQESPSVVKLMLYIFGAIFGLTLGGLAIGFIVRLILRKNHVIDD